MKAVQASVVLNHWDAEIFQGPLERSHGQPSPPPVREDQHGLRVS